MVNVKDIAITSLETITAFETAANGGAYMFTVDELQNASINQGQEKSDITGKGGRKLNTLKRNKTVTISGANGLVSGGLLELQTGSKFENKRTLVMWTETVSVGANHKANTQFTAVGTAGSEIENAYIRNQDGTLGTALVQAATVSSGKFAYAPNNKELTFHSDIAEGTEVVVYYSRYIMANVLTNESDKYSGKCALYIDAIGEDKCAKVYRIQFYIPQADFNGEFNFEMGNDQTVHNFEADALAGGCGAGGQLWTYTIFGEDEGDPEEEGSY